MNRAQRRASAPPRSNIRTIGAAYDVCPFRTLVAIAPGTRDELLERLGASFAAIDGEVSPIAPDALATLVNTVLSGQTVLVMANRVDLRDAARTQVMAAVNAAAVGAAGSA